MNYSIPDGKFSNYKLSDVFTVIINLEFYQHREEVFKVTKVNLAEFLAKTQRRKEMVSGFLRFDYYCNIINNPHMKRYGQVIGIRPEYLERYKKYHAAVWPEVLSMIKKCNMQNYTIFYKDNLLYAYFEYTGSDFAADMAKMAADPKTQEWWSVMEPMQEPVSTRKPGEWWANMEEVFHVD